MDMQQAVTPQLPSVSPEADKAAIHRVDLHSINTGTQYIVLSSSEAHEVYMSDNIGASRYNLL